jgi:hypothetical protein
VAGDEEVERLRRVAYGPGAGAEERAAAAAELRALAGETGSRTEAAARETPHDDRVEVDAATVDIMEVREGDAPESVWARRIRVGWLVPIVAGALLAGAVGALAANATFTASGGDSDASASPTSVVLLPNDDQGTIVLVGDPERADGWFRGQAAASDAYPYSGFLEHHDIDPYETRFAQVTGDGWSLWVARTRDGNLCLLSAFARESTGSATCVDRAAFSAGGVHLPIGKQIVHWFGGEILITLTDEPGVIRLPSS